MRNTIWITSLVVPALLTAGAFGQGLPRGRSGGRFGDFRSGDDRSPSMSRVRTPSGTDRDRSDRGRRGDSRQGKPVVIAPPANRVPPRRPPNLRPGVGSLPSGKKQSNRGQLSGFLQLPGSCGRVIIRQPSPPTRRRPSPRVSQPPSPPTRRTPAPPIHQPPLRVRKPLIYKPDWSRKTPFTSSWYKTRMPPVTPHRTARYHPWVLDRPGRRSNHWWARATATALTNWLPYRWTRPVYYVYGLGGNVFYHESVVYVDGARYSTADAYYQQARAIALAAPNLDQAAARLEWLPLGVFAITRKGVTETNTYLQLAVTRDGIIGGTYFNAAAGASRPIEGTVDKNTQRAAWTFADGKNTEFVVETSFYNLTQNEVPMLVHFGPGRTQEGLLIRMEWPGQE